MYKADLETGELFLYDAIGDAYWGFIDAATVMSDLGRMKGKRAIVRLASPGGSVDEGKAIFNALKRHPGGVDVAIDATAYSIAGYIAMAGERIVMARNSMQMHHNPWTMAMGDANELRKTADVLDKYRLSIIEDYADRTGKTPEEIVAIFNAETWYTATEALEAGFATEVGDIVLDNPPEYKAAMFHRGPKLEKPKAGTRMDVRIPAIEARLKAFR
jgi:ATP-dependent Clp protease, protease subunit